MIDKKELYKEINKIAYEILDEIVSPICKIPKGRIWADLFHADICCYAMGDKENEQIFEEINKKYNLGFDYKLVNDDGSEEHIPAPITDRWSLASIALYIILNREDE